MRIAEKIMLGKEFTEFLARIASGEKIFEGKNVYSIRIHPDKDINRDCIRFTLYLGDLYFTGHSISVTYEHNEEAVTSGEIPTIEWMAALKKIME